MSRLAGIRNVQEVAVANAWLAQPPRARNERLAREVRSPAGTADLDARLCLAPTLTFVRFESAWKRMRPLSISCRKPKRLA